jgi:hypothetical protein
MAADRLCANVVAVLVTRMSDSAVGPVRKALGAAILHPVEQVCSYAAWGVNSQVWQVDRSLALRCVNAIALQARRLQELWQVNERRVWHPDAVEARIADIGQEVRRAFEKLGGLPDDAYVEADLENPLSGDASARILTILAFAPEAPATVTAFESASRRLAKEWDEGDSRRGSGQGKRGSRRQRDFHGEQATKDLIERYVMNASQESAQRALLPILDAVGHHPRDVYPIVQGLTLAEDRSPNTEQYWFIWSLFAARVRAAPWAERLNLEHPAGTEMLIAIFMNSYWKDGVRHWRSVEGHVRTGVNSDNLDWSYIRISLCGCVFDGRAA